MMRKTVEYADTAEPSDRRRLRATTRKWEWFHAAERGIEDAIADELVGAPERACPFESSTYRYAWRGAYTTYRQTGEDIRKRYKLRAREDASTVDPWRDVRARLQQARKDWEQQAAGNVFVGERDDKTAKYLPDPTLTAEDLEHARLRVREIDLELARTARTRKKL